MDVSIPQKLCLAAVGNVTVRRHTDSGLVDVVHHITFAFAFFAFHLEGQLLGELTLKVFRGLFF